MYKLIIAAVAVGIASPALAQVNCQRDMIRGGVTCNPTFPSGPQVSRSESFITGYIRGRMLRMELEEQALRLQAARRQAQRWGDWEPIR